jgi:hypothetical protein
MTFTFEDAKNLLSIFISLGINAKQSGWHSQARGMMVGDQTAIESFVFLFDKKCCGWCAVCNK